jgi:hypothetical protein
VSGPTGTTGEPDLLDPEIAAALAVLARTGRVLAIVIPRGISDERVRELQREINERLDQLVAERGPLE